MKFNKKINIFRAIANLLTILRILIAFPIIILLQSSQLSLAWILMIIAIFTDYLDGKLARMVDNGNVFGSRLDPLADKILICAPLLWIAQQDVLPLWALWLLISRELLVSGWRANHKSGGAASSAGKLKTIIQFTSLLLIMWPEYWGSISIVLYLKYIGILLFWPALLISYYSAYKYFRSQAN